jgi:hypothetical protein
LTIGFVRPSSPRAIASRASNGSPVAFAPSFCPAQRFAHQREYERLGDAHERELDVRIADGEHVALDIDHADAEELARNARECRERGRRSVSARCAHTTASFGPCVSFRRAPP